MLEIEIMFIETLFTGIFQIFGWIFFIVMFIVALRIYGYKLRVKLSDIFGDVYEHTDENVKKAYILKLEDIEELNHIKTNAKNDSARMWASERLEYLNRFN